jgi:signal transduction histidine kinase/cell division protein FtsL
VNRADLTNQVRARRLGVRKRVLLSYALGALLLSSAMGIVAWTLSSRYLLAQRQAAAVRQTLMSAQIVERSTSTSGADIPELLQHAIISPGARSLLHRDGRWYASALTVQPGDLPSALRAMVLRGQPARQRVHIHEVPALVVGVSLPTSSAAYFQVFPLEESDRTLRTLSLTLAAAAILTTAMGAGLGQWASGRALQPLAEVTKAASAIASGRHDARLVAVDDPDLAGLAHSFNTTAAALEDRIRRDARFASDVSHELRTPLTTMLNAVELLCAQRGQFPEPAREVVDLLAAEVRRFHHMVLDLLEISRFDDAVAQLAVTTVRVGEFVMRVADTAAGCPVTCVAPDAVDTVVLGDPRRLERVVVNLVINAKTHGGGVRQVLVERQGASVRIVVDDAGPGVPEEWRTEIFERFARGPAARVDSDGYGVGLGLALVAQQARLHDGRAWVEDAPGGGARFVVELPVAEP